MMIAQRFDACISRCRTASASFPAAGYSLCHSLQPLRNAESPRLVLHQHSIRCVACLFLCDRSLVHDLQRPSLSLVTCPGAKQANVFRMAAAVLALGDVDFIERPEATDTEPLTQLAEASRPRLEAAAKLLDVSADKILSALTSRKINAGISNQVQRLTRHTAVRVVRV